MSKYNKEPLDFVMKTMQDDPVLSITKATRIMCEHFEIEYTDNVRRAMSNLLSARSFTDNVPEEVSELFEEAKKKKLDNDSMI